MESEQIPQAKHILLLEEVEVDPRVEIVYLYELPVYSGYHEVEDRIWHAL
jgi:hypothetical protein